MIAQISDELYPQLNACGKIIENHVDEDISVYGDSDKLARVFNNILKMPFLIVRKTALSKYQPENFQNGL